SVPSAGARAAMDSAATAIRARKPACQRYRLNAIRSPSRWVSLNPAPHGRHRFGAALAHLAPENFFSASRAAVKPLSEKANTAFLPPPMATATLALVPERIADCCSA